MDAGRSADRRVAGGNGASGLQQALERLGRGEIRPRRALADAECDVGLGDILSRARHQQAGLGQLVDARDGKNHHIGGFASVELALQDANGAEVEYDLMAGGPPPKNSPPPPPPQHPKPPPHPILWPPPPPPPP